MGGGGPHRKRRPGSTSGPRLFPVIWAAWLGAGAGQVSTSAEVSREYQVKAAFLLNLARFVKWPPVAGADAGAPIVIGVLGEDPFGAVLEQTVQGETVQDRRLTIRRSNKVADLKDCELVFVSRSERARLGDVLAELEGARSVTVGEVDGFARRGGVIGFFVERDKVRFEINVDVARKKGLKISSQLLKLGRIVGPAAGEGER